MSIYGGIGDTFNAYSNFFLYIFIAREKFSWEKPFMMEILCDRNCLMKIERHHYGSDFYRSDARIVVWVWGRFATKTNECTNKSFDK